MGEKTWRDNSILYDGEQLPRYLSSSLGVVLFPTSIALQLLERSTKMVFTTLTGYRWWFEDYTARQQEKYFQDALPVPLSERPQHRIELLSNKSASSKDQSPLLARLPTEVRLLIYEHAIGGQHLHIISKYRRLGHTVCDDKYWAENRAKRPGLRASSYLFTYAALPTTKQLADWSICNLLVTCRKVLEEAVTVLYKTNTFVFWDLRTVASFRAGIPEEHWLSIRYINIYAMTYRKDDGEKAVEAKSFLQHNHWHQLCSALATLPRLKRFRIFVGHISFLDKTYLMGGRADLDQAVLTFMKQLNGLKSTCEIYFASERCDEERQQCLWNLRGMGNAQRAQLEMELREDGLVCSVLVGDVWTVDKEAKGQSKREERIE